MRKKYLIICFFLLAMVLAVVSFFSVKNILADNDSAVVMTVKILVCGNEVREGWEQCDRGDFGGLSCTTLGYGVGDIVCTPDCELDISDCPPGQYCGDGSCNNSEGCGSCPADCGACPSGGGGSSYVAPVTNVIFSGRAYPKSTVTLLKDAQVVATTVADANANFKLNITGLNGGIYIFSLYGEDYKGIRSSLISFPSNIITGATTQMSGIFIAPTISVDKSEVKKGDNVAIFGQSISNGEITISIHSDEEIFGKIKTDSSGVYLYNLDTSPLEVGQHFTKAKAAFSNEISSFSKAVSFTVGEKSVAIKKATIIGDLNDDGRVNIIDFSIMAYWYKRLSPPAKVDLNGDGKISLIDLSIMVYNWTG